MRANPPRLFPSLLDARRFDALSGEYHRACGFRLCVVDTEGRWLHGPPADRTDDEASRRLRADAVAESLRWGEPCVLGDGTGGMLWAMPVMRNQSLLGGVAVCRVPLRRPATAGALDQRITHACSQLLELAIRHNLANAALLAERREAARREREKAEALHALKEAAYDDIRCIYLHEEPALIAAIRRGERRAARHAINRVLTAIYMLGQSRIELLKSLALELVVTMTRTAVQAGGSPEKILGLNYQSLSRLAEIGDQEALAGWLCGMLESLIDAIESNHRPPNSAPLARAFEHIQSHLADELTREAVAQAAGLSPSHFSHLMKARTGWTFTELLTHLRLERARQLLTRTDTGLADIAAACGFTDQSYFTRVFRKAHRFTPGEFRRTQSPSRRNSAPKSQTRAPRYKPGSGTPDNLLHR